MFIRKYEPVYAPEVEGGVDNTEVTPPIVPDKLDGPGSGRGSLRKALEASVKEHSEVADVEDKKVAKKAPAREGRGAAVKSRARQELEEQEETDVTDEADDSLLEGEEPEEQATEAQAPKAWDKEAKAVWDAIPPAAKAAVTKREQDIARGVENLKKNYADIDAALAPRLQVIRDQGHTPAQAVNQLFLWMEALGQDPVRLQNGQPPMALLALAHSFGIDLAKLIGGQQQPGEEQQQKAAVEGEEVPPAIQKYISTLETRLNQLGEQVQGGFQQVQQTQSMKETNAIMEGWSTGKPYFDEVRRDMAYIIGSHMIPPKPDGQADLDKAYDMALYANPAVREKVLADRRKNALEKRRKAEEAEKAVQQTAADKARRAGSGLGPSAPGATMNPGKEVKKRGKSVRESLADAMEELGN